MKLWSSNLLTDVAAFSLQDARKSGIFLEERARGREEKYVIIFVPFLAFFFKKKLQNCI